MKGINKLSLILLIAGFSLLSGCSLFQRTPQKKLQRLLEKHPELIQKDSLKIQDSIFTPSTSFDTVFKAKIGDTTIIYKDRVKVLHSLQPNNIVYMKFDQPSDTMILNRTVYFPKIVNVKPDRITEFIKTLPFYLGILLVAAIFQRIFSGK